jgi:hypothetical protein
MEVFQSTKEHITRGYIDSDRCVFGVALATNYDPGKAAIEANRNARGEHGAVEPDRNAGGEHA